MTGVDAAAIEAIRRVRDAEERELALLPPAVEVPVGTAGYESYVIDRLPPLDESASRD